MILLLRKCIPIIVLFLNDASSKVYYFNSLEKVNELMNNDNDSSIPKEVDLIIVLNVPNVVNKNKYVAARSRFTNELKVEVNERKKASIVKKQNEKYIEEIVDFLKDHYTTTLYFYKEMKRIREQRMVKDELRLMIDDLESSPRKKENVLACYNKIKNYRLRPDVWEQKTNNLIINVLKDPENDGVS